ncbi:GNAT family N-acetyltransferase [Methanocella arvoryzae]|uniref:Acetyltransferase (GNAT family) n=1 Tax=Methanocella arvoryzae (strain DSM 22066 / NBRC 105507 / MRE50) TaxID=351160 RepID=Q0W4D1_METAR|nr:GNAT family N-acetyltransferase [Methanocella arvoryzae]CAJ36762.1 putative acetyltransferase (GNAT family) [Methanocella arvoryzae MRE50]
MIDIRFSSITECPELHDKIAGWLWSFWGNSSNYPFYRSLVANARDDDFPLVYMAFIGDIPVGTVALWRADLLSRQDLFPWLADLFVPPEHRSKGIGTALQNYAVEKAKEFGYPALYLYTPLEGYYEKSGWEYVCDEVDKEGEKVRVYKKATGCHCGRDAQR